MSNEGRSRWSLEALGQDRGDAAGSKRQELIGEQRWLEFEGCRRQGHYGAARSAGAAFVLVGVDKLSMRCGHRRRRHIDALFHGVVVITVCTIALMLMLKDDTFFRLGSVPYAVMAWTTERHGRRRSSLNGNSQHQQPHQ